MQLRPLLTQLSILNKRLEVVRFKPNWAQEEYIDAAEDQLNNSGRIRIIVLKARQVGVSTVTEALAFSLCFLIDHYKVSVVSHELDSAQHLLGITHLYWETYPFKSLYHSKYLARNNLAWRETSSSMRVATAKNTRAGRSQTIHFLHASEVAFWDKASELMTGMRQTIPTVDNTAIILESTANGVGNYFHTTWNAAVAGDNDYRPLFFPWHRHPEYMASAIDLSYANIGRLDDEERILRAIGISDDRLAWRRYAIKNLCDNDILKFHQEYPTTPEEAFLSTGTNVFPHAKLKSIYEPLNGVRGRLVRTGASVVFVPHPDGPVFIFRKPSKDRDWGQYLIGGDPTHTVGGDFAVGQVLNRRTLEQVAVWRGRTDPGTFAEELAKLGIYYNTAIIAPEKEGPGYLTVGKLLGMEYPRVWQHAKADKTPGKLTGDTYGWSTNQQSKHLAIGWLLKVVVDGYSRESGVGLLLHDRATYNELSHYITLDGGGYGPADQKLGGHDDTVMSLAIAVTCHFMEAPVGPYGEGEPLDSTGETIEAINDSLPAWSRWGSDDE